MKNNFSILILSILFFTSCNQIIEDDNTFTLNDLDIALIHEKKIKDISCLLFNISDTINKNVKNGIVFKLDMKYNHIKSNGCCTIEPGLDGTKEKIKEIRIIFKTKNQKTDITNLLYNEEEAQKTNDFEDYIQASFRSNDYSCVCLNKKTNELEENVKREHLGGNLIVTRANDTILPFFKNINDFKDYYNSFSEDKYKGQFDTTLLHSGFALENNYQYFWLPKDLTKNLSKNTFLEIEIQLYNGKTLSHKRKIFLQ